MDKVYWVSFSAGPGASLEQKFSRLLQQAGIAALAAKGGLAAIKLHVGERGNLAYVNHNYARTIVDTLRAGGAKPFLTDTNTLYSGGRRTAVDHLQTAAMHGFSASTVGAPFIVADGLRGLDYEEIPVQGLRLAKVRLASALCQADSLVMLSHFKGHCEMGFGGTMKNAGMGCGAVPGKLEMHSSSHPRFIEEKCTGCGQCLRRCPTGAITMAERKAVVDQAVCIGCGQCVAACDFSAMRVKWEEHGERLIEKVCDYAAALCGRFDGRALYLNYVASISPDCDCWDYNDLPVKPDIGIFASTNPLALDRASLDAVNSEPSTNGTPAAKGENVFTMLHPDSKNEYLFDCCKRLGMDDAYTMVEVK